MHHHVNHASSVIHLLRFRFYPVYLVERIEEAQSSVLKSGIDLLSLSV